MRSSLRTVLATAAVALLVLGTAQGAAAEAEVPVPVPPGQVVDPAAPDSDGDAGGAAGGGAESGAAGGVGGGVGTTSGDGPDGAGVAGETADGGADNGAGADPEPTEQLAADESGAAADAASTAPAKAGAQTAAKTAAAKKTQSQAQKLRAFVKKVHKQARKKAGNPKAFSDSFGAYKTSKKQTGYVIVRSKGYHLSNPSMSTAGRYGKAVSSILKKYKLKPVGSSKFGQLQSKTYSGKRYTCTVRQSRSGAASTYGHAAFTCQTTAKVKKEHKKLAPFIAAYKRGGKNPNKVAFGTSVDSRSSDSSTYSGYKRAALSAVPPASGGQMGWYRSLYSKAPGKNWILTASTTASTGPFACETLERGATHARAWAWEPCSRGGSFRANSYVDPYAADN
ncbi:MAG: hypothetical protein ACK5LO_17015 [Leucobacter sp.]